MIVFPMAGLSRRFIDAGYHLPKYMLPAKGKTVLWHVLSGFERYFHSQKFLFIVRDVFGTPEFVREQCRIAGIRQAIVVVLPESTKGQAETVALGLQRANVSLAESLTIFNIDTFRHGFTFSPLATVSGVAGYLEVFKGAGNNWSYVRPDEERNTHVLEVTEKIPISDLCCTGLYHFESGDLFLSAYNRYLSEAGPVYGLSELFVAPMFNILIRDGEDVRYQLIEESAVTFCGVPSEYEAFIVSP